jgi:hypothetical protein
VKESKRKSEEGKKEEGMEYEGEKRRETKVEEKGTSRMWKSNKR